MAKKYIYRLDDAGRAAAAEYVNEWTAIAFRTGLMNEAERAAVRAAVTQLYEAASLTPPRNIVIAPGPMSARFAAGAAAAIWHRRKSKTDAATRDATAAATDAATYAATYDATRATWYRGKEEAAAVCFKLADLFGLLCAKQAWRFYHGGSTWAAVCAYLAFGRDYVGLEARGIISAEQYRKYQPFEDLARISGWRYMHEKFCIVTDRPLKLMVDDRNRPHCDDGPFAEWADGTKFYAVHGVLVPWDIIEKPETITVARIDAETNAEVRRVMLGRFGIARYVRESGANVVHSDTDQYGRSRRLLRRDVPDDEPIVMIEVTNSTPEPDGAFRTYMLRVDPNAYGGRASKECHAAIASTFRAKRDRSKLYFARPEDYSPRIET